MFPLQDDLYVNVTIIILLCVCDPLWALMIFMKLRFGYTQWIDTEFTTEFNNKIAKLYMSHLYLSLTTIFQIENFVHSYIHSSMFNVSVYGPYPTCHVVSQINGFAGKWHRHQ